MVAAVEVALGFDASDASVDVGLLILVDPSGWYPFGESVGVDAASSAFLQEVGVVVSAEQGQIVKIGWAAEDPVEDVVSVAPLGWVGAAGETTSTISGDQCHGLTAGGQPSGSAERKRDAVSIDDGGPNLGFVGDPEELIGGELGAVGVAGPTGVGC